MVISRLTDILTKFRENEMVTHDPVTQQGKLIEEPNPTEPAPPDCFSCRLIGGIGLTCMGLVLIYEPYRLKHAKVKPFATKVPKMMLPKTKSVVCYSLGITCIGLGILRYNGMQFPDIEKAIYQDMPQWLLGKEE